MERKTIVGRPCSEQTESTQDAPAPARLSRQRFLTRTSGTMAAPLAAAAVPTKPVPRAMEGAWPHAAVAGASSPSRRGRARADQAFAIRVAAARAKRALPCPGREAYPPLIDA